MIDINSESIREELSPMIQYIISLFDIPGLAVGIVKNKDIVYIDGFGYKNIDTKEPITPTTIFDMASISKLFVATAIMQLVEQDRIDLEKPVTHYLPYFKLESKEYKDITIKQMLSHVSGMGNPKDYEYDKPQYDEGALERYVRSLADERLLFTPGARFAYSDTAYDCLGDIIAKVSGMSFADYEKKHILGPVGMYASTFLKPEYLPEDWAAPHVRTLRTHVWEGYPYNRMHCPSSTLHSNVLEMCNWAIVNLNRGVIDHKRILNSSSYDILWKPLAETGWDAMSSKIGLGWFIGEYKGKRTIRHSGADIGFRTDFVMIPEEDLAVTIMCNGIPSPVTKLIEAVLDMALGYDPVAIIPHASIKVLKTLDEKGLDKAIEEWVMLKQNHPDEYDFDEYDLGNLGYYQVFLDRVNDAREMALLCVEILPEQIMKQLETALEAYLKRHPDNKAAPVMLEIIRTQ